VTFTLPAGLRAVARHHQRTIYILLFRTAATALQQLAHDPRFLGGQIGMIGVLQTWTRALRYHPHVHYRVPALGLAPDGQTWIVGRKPFLVHVRPLAQLFRAKFRAALRQTPLFAEVSGDTWTQAGVVDCRPVGSGHAALSNNRIVSVQDDQVTFRYTDRESGRTKTCRLSAEEFIRRFLQHVLPRGRVSVRYYGLCRVGNRHLLAQARTALAPPTAAAGEAAVAPTSVPPAPDVLRCPRCGQPMVLVQTIPRTSRSPPAAIQGG